ncbi:unnamed protein product [Alopecurus aequalis]
MKPHRRRRRRRRQPRRGDAEVALPTELVLEILERASPSTAVRCAATCRPWLRLVSRRSFVRRASRPRRALLLGFFAFDHADDDEQLTLHSRIVPSPGGPDGWPCPCSPRLDPRCQDMDPVLSRNGYVVLRRVTLAKPGGPTPTAINYCVCNPATGSCHFLPPFHVDEDVGFWEYSCALLTGRDFNHRPSSQGSLFELVVAGIPTDYRQELLVSIFSSSTTRWSSVRSVEIPPCYPFCFDSEMARRHGSSYYRHDRAWSDLEMHPRSAPAVSDGTICWQCTCDGTDRVVLTLDLTGRWDVDFLDLPNERRCSGTPYWDFDLLLGCRDGGVLLAFSLTERRRTMLTMWEWLRVRIGCKDVPMWRPSGEIDLRVAVSEALGPSASCGGGGGEYSDDMGVRLLWYCEKSNVLVFSTAALGNFALDLETKCAEALGKILRCKSESSQ